MADLTLEEMRRGEWGVLVEGLQLHARGVAAKDKGCRPLSQKFIALLFWQNPRPHSAP